MKYRNISQREDLKIGDYCFHNDKSLEFAQGSNFKAFFDLIVGANVAKQQKWQTEPLHLL